MPLPRGRPKRGDKPPPSPTLVRAKRNLYAATKRGSNTKEFWEGQIGKLTAGALPERDTHRASREVYDELRALAAKTLPPPLPPKPKPKSPPKIAKVAKTVSGCGVCPYCGETFVFGVLPVAKAGTHVSVKI